VQQPVQPAGNACEITTESWASGLYYLHMEQQSRLISRKLVKVRD